MSLQNDISLNSTTSRSPSKRMRVAMASLMALGVFGSGAAMADELTFDAASYEEAAIISEMTIPSSVPAVEFQAEKTPNKWLIGGAMALILAALTKLVGANRVINIVADAGPTMRKAAESLANAPKAAAAAVGNAVAYPMKFLMLVGGLAMIGFTGISIFDLQWTAGIATGIGMTAVTWFGASKLKNPFKRKKVKIRS